MSFESWTPRGAAPIGLRRARWMLLTTRGEARYPAWLEAFWDRGAGASLVLVHPDLAVEAVHVLASAGGC